MTPTNLEGQLERWLREIAKEGGDFDRERALALAAEEIEATGTADFAAVRDALARAAEKTRA